MCYHQVASEVCESQTLGRNRIVGSPSIPSSSSQYMKIHKFFFLSALLIVVVGVVVLAKKPDTTSVPIEVLEQQEKKITISQSIQADTSSEPIHRTSSIMDGESVLKALIAESGLSVETKEYDFGTLVESINGRKNGEDNKYWTFKVNDQEATVGAGEYILKEGDSVVWEFKSL